MGSNSAPVVADVFLFILERLLVERFKKEGLLLFQRYRDDLFAMFETPAQAEEFGRLYDTLHPRIKLEIETSQAHANVLDIRISKFEDGSLRTGVYFKPMNSLPLLHHRSNHPVATLRAAIKARVLNFVRICNNREDLVNAIFSLANSAERYDYTEADILAVAHDTVKECAGRQWPFLADAAPTKRSQRDWRPVNETVYVRALQPLYDIARKRHIRLVTKFGPSVVKQLSRTKDC
jgi:hypothetical protein